MAFIKVPTPSGEPYFVNSKKVQRIVTVHEICRNHLNEKTECYLVLDGESEVTVRVELPIEKVAKLFNQAEAKDETNRCR